MLICILFASGSSVYAQQYIYRAESLPQWDRVLKLYYKAKRSISLKEIKRINIQINNYLYIEDIDNYSKIDYWASPQEFYAAQGGDCEDYAIAKYFALIEHGIPSKDLAIIVGRRNNKPHATLQLHYDGEIYYLDNQFSDLKKSKVFLQEFQPLYYMNDIFFGINSDQANFYKFRPNGQDVYYVSNLINKKENNYE